MTDAGCTPRIMQYVPDVVPDIYDRCHILTYAFEPQLHGQLLLASSSHLGLVPASMLLQGGRGQRAHTRA